MQDSPLYFQYCPKFVLFSADWSQVLLARRAGEADYDGTFSFIGGKAETTDEDLVASMRREKSEEIGADAQVEVCMTVVRPLLFRKKSGDSMVIPHHIAHYLGGDIRLNPDEYSEYLWVSVQDLESLEPKIANIPEFVEWATHMRSVLMADDYERL